MHAIFWAWYRVSTGRPLAQPMAGADAATPGTVVFSVVAGMA